jgi:hypothetical protein
MKRKWNHASNWLYKRQILPKERYVFENYQWIECKKKLKDRDRENTKGNKRTAQNQYREEYELNKEKLKFIKQD